MQVRTKEEIDHNEILDFEMISFEGHKPQWRPGQSGGPEKVKMHIILIFFQSTIYFGRIQQQIFKVQCCNFESQFFNFFGDLIDLTCVFIQRNPWELSPGWGKHMRRNYAAQAANSVRRRMRIEKGPQWGAVSSHLYEKYPECVERDWPKYTRMSRERKAAEGD